VALVAGRVSGSRRRENQTRQTPLAATAVMTVGAAAVSFGGSRSGLLALVLLVAGLILVLGRSLAGAARRHGHRVVSDGAAVAGLLLALFAFFGGDGLITLYVTAGLGDSIAGPPPRCPPAASRGASARWLNHGCSTAAGSVAWGSCWPAQS
jgi:hypothetical protein